MVETQGVRFPDGEVSAVAVSPIEEVDIGFAELLNQHELTDALQQASDERLVSVFSPMPAADLATGNRADQRVTPVPLEHGDFHPGEQLGR